ncbi:hypothetical protein SCALIN_C05_0224 [Candidatus Scalindua japonica]|uniref:Baseplate protein J-like domain-containing protein n=1 Tax=Candidatus Scalindua japonica TaxID=1284222 RepID=A0A286TW74_9BACT|nr:putative baseplate assembly protein [Candidatus Scalindua japonica]GAX60139.1 hypothetical protein SCALIN_C05_0224 [Candidatus Scalindua japonica]
MKTENNKSFRDLNDCGCCEGIAKKTPTKVYNRPGLSAIAYRVGVHSYFKQTMLANLSGSSKPALSNLTTRDNDDFSIALLDGWATVLDVLTFYQERLANESYLNTVTERLSALELARLIGYELSPGVAGNTCFAFTVEDAPGSFGEALIPDKNQLSMPSPPPIKIEAGVKVQSVPGPDEIAQIYETIEEINARPEWSSIKPRLTQPQNISIGMGSVILTGIATNLKNGDKLLIIANSERDTRTIMKVTTDEERNTTRIDFENPGLSPADFERPSLPNGNVSDYAEKVELDSIVIEDIIGKKWSEEDLSALIKSQGWSEEKFVTNMVKQVESVNLTNGTGIFAFIQHAAIFGHNAPYYKSLLRSFDKDTPLKIQSTGNYANTMSEGNYSNTPVNNYIYPHDWDSNEWEIWKNSMKGTYYNSDADIYLERSLEGVIKGTWILIERPAANGPTYDIYKISSVSEASLVGFGMSAKTTGLKLSKIDGSSLSDNSTDKPPDFKVRKSIIRIQSEQLELAKTPIEDLVEGDIITLDSLYLGLKIGQKIILTGERDDLKGVYASEAKVLKKVFVENGFTVLNFENSLSFSYIRNTVTINANIAEGTHGETVSEVLGSGNTNQPFQSFELKQSPLTYVSATTTSGSQTTLEILVNDILWEETSSFYGQGPNDRIYKTRVDDDGKTTVIFGDGITGSLLPTGQQNIKAKYRKGIGLKGLVKADQLTQLMTKPLGVKGVTNPIPSTGASDRERLDNVRLNAPLTVLTLDRIVSLKDYEDFARSFEGIDKALATWSWNGLRRTVFITVAGPNGVEVEKAICNSLLDTIHKYGDPFVPIIIKSYQKIFFRIEAKIEVLPEYLDEEVMEKVLEQVKQALFDNFSFDKRQFAQPVYFSEVLDVMHAVKGVKAIDLDKLYRIDDPDKILKQGLEASMPGIENDNFIAAELLMLETKPNEIEVIQ